jgi:ATP-binding cassette subfamily B multidrug efflux pump
LNREPAATNAQGDLEQIRASANMRSLAKLLPFARPYLWQFLIVVGLVIVYNTTSVLQPYLVKIAIDSDISGPRPHPGGLMTIGVFYVSLVAVGLAANIAQMLLLQNAGQRVIRQIRIALFTHIERQGMQFFDENPIGRLVTNVSNDTETVSQFFTNFFLSIIRDGLSIVMIVATMFELDVHIAAYCMLLLPVIFLVSLIFRRRQRNAYQVTRTRLSNVIAFLAENLAGMRMTQIFHQETRQARHFEERNDGHRRANVREYGISMMFNRSLDLLGNLAVAAVVWLGGGAVLDHAILFGTLYAFISYVRNFFAPINSITQNWNTVQASMVSAERIGRVLGTQSRIVDPEEPVTLERVRGQVEFRDVHFAYKPGEPVLKGISFTIEPGLFVGFAGATGAGKSSLMSLLTRFYDVTRGAVMLDGVDIRSFRQSDLHRYVGMVQQDLQLFTGTVADNIRLFRPEITDRAVEAAARAVGAHDAIMRLPKGYETHLYAKGANLSMGERQLISFARIIAFNPRVLILDEATASLDSQTEEWVQNGLRSVARERTTLVIAHRLSTIRGADRIYVLDKGRIAESGTHGELVAKRGLYAGMLEGKPRRTDPLDRPSQLPVNI